MVALPQSNIEWLSQLKRLTGFPLQLKPFESIKKIEKKGDTVTILIETYEVVERRVDFWIKAKGHRLIGITPNGAIWKVNTVVIWDDTFEPYFTNKFGPGQTPAQAAARRARERMAYRVGNERSPLDNYDRTTQHADYSPQRMQGHWGRS